MAAFATLKLTGLALALAIGVGLCLALARISRFGPLRAVAVAYIEAVRGIPALALLFVIYFGLPDLGMRFDSFTAAVIGLGLNGGAYLAEVFRAGIQAIHRGQIKAALSIGMTPWTAMLVIILPQAVRVILPPLANYAIALLKDTSIYSIISTPELMLRDDLVTGPAWYVTDGGVVPPERPGLGVELDRGALDRYAEAFREKGELTYFDAA